MNIYKFVSLIILLFSISGYSAESDMKSGISISTGVQFITSEPGYVLRVTTPHFIGKLAALQFQFGQQLFSGLRSSSGTFEDSSYYLIEPAYVMRYPLLNYLRPYILLGFPYYNGNAVSDQPGMGSHLALGAEFLKSPDSSFMLFGEIGYYFMFNGKADKYSGNPHYGQGVAFAIGVKGYLY